MSENCDKILTRAGRGKGLWYLLADVNNYSLQYCSGQYPVMKDSRLAVSPPLSVAKDNILYYDHITVHPDC